MRSGATERLDVVMTTGVGIPRRNQVANSPGDGWVFFFSGGCGLTDPVKGPSEHLSSGPLPETEGPGPKTEPPQTSQQLVYVFTTSLANR